MMNLSSKQLNVLSRDEQRDLLEEQHQERVEREKELNELASFYDRLDDDMDLYDLRSEKDYLDSYVETAPYGSYYDEGDDYPSDFDSSKCLFFPSDFH